MNLLRTIFVEDAVTKIAALMLALFVWFFLHSQDSEQRTERLSFALQLSREDVAISRITDLNGDPVIGDRVEVIFRGPRRAMTSDYFRSIRLAQTLEVPEDFFQGSDERRMVVSLSNSTLNLPPDVLIHSVKPAELEVTLALRGTKMVQIEATPENHVEGAPADGKIVAALRPIPDRITVSGPKSLIDGLKAVPIQNVDVNGLAASATVKGRIVEQLEGVVISTRDSFRLEIVISEQPLEKAIPAHPIDLLVPPDFEHRALLRVDQDNAKVTLTGPKNLVEQIIDGKIPFHVFADIANTPLGIDSLIPGAFAQCDLEVHTSSAVSSQVKWTLEPPQITLRVDAGEEEESPPEEGGNGETGE